MFMGLYIILFLYYFEKKKKKFLFKKIGIFLISIFRIENHILLNLIFRTFLHQIYTIWQIFLKMNYL